MLKGLPKIPDFLERKFYKTGQTRGADDTQVYQNRVSRNSTVLIPFKEWVEKESIRSDAKNNKFENGYIVLINPSDYFNNKVDKMGLNIGKDLLVFFRSREDWNRYKKPNWKPASSRNSPFLGQYISRIPATTAAKNLNAGFISSGSKGAGIRLYEYSDKYNIENCRLQLEAIFWLCKDSYEVMKITQMSKNSSITMDPDDIKLRKESILKSAEEKGLLDKDKLVKSRIINRSNITVCPLCLEEISASGFITHLKIPEGREVPDLTVTQNNLFHIDELKYGVYNHKPYNLGWGHHYCNVVAKDTGISAALNWMQKVLDRNKKIENLINEK